MAARKRRTSGKQRAAAMRNLRKAWAKLHGGARRRKR